jgi:DNA-binding MarR family transcriptional regulator
MVAATSETNTGAPARPSHRQRPGFLLAQLGRAVTRRYRSGLAPIGLKPRETATLLRLRDGGAVSQQDLGSTLDIDASNLVVLLNDLESAELIRRYRDPADRRRHVVEISEGGTKILDEVDHASEAIEDEFFSALTRSERDMLRDLLARLAQDTDFPAPPEEIEKHEGC